MIHIIHTSNSSRAAFCVVCIILLICPAIVNWSCSDARRNTHRDEITEASCSAARAESTNRWAREHRVMEESDRFALRNQVVRSAGGTCVSTGLGEWWLSMRGESERSGGGGGDMDAIPVENVWPGDVVCWRW
jgi:hypothetical protein